MLVLFYKILFQDQIYYDYSFFYLHVPIYYMFDIIFWLFQRLNMYIVRAVLSGLKKITGYYNLPYELYGE